MKLFTYLRTRVVICSWLFALFFVFNSCKKFLDQKPDKKLTEPSTVQDAQALLDNYNIMNLMAPYIGLLSDDDFYLKTDFLNTLRLNDRNGYLWQKDIQLDESWKWRYMVVLSANLSLETLNKIPKTVLNQASYEYAYGGALFFRSLAFFHLAEVFAPPYDVQTAGSVLGIPLRLSSDINTVNKRNTVEETYSRIVKDLKTAIPLLPAKSSIVTQASKAAAFALLSNTYLTMREYHFAGLYADSALQIHNTLLEYNQIDPSSTSPFSQFNAEVIFFSSTGGGTYFYMVNRKVDSVLYSNYEENDLRKNIFFQATGSDEYGFKGNYQGWPYGELFNGFAVDEMLLIRAECAARENKIELALNDLNTLLVTRYKAGTFQELNAASANDVLELVLKERRKELICRGRRWMDLRRLNKEPQFEKTLTRIVDGKKYELLPNSSLYTFDIPQSVINYSGIPQNER